MSILVSESGQALKAPIVLNEAEGYVIQKAFGITEEGMPKKPRNLFRAGIVPPGSDKEKILHSMARKGLVELIGVIGTKLNDADRLKLEGALALEDEAVAVRPERIEARVTPYGLECFLHTVKQSDAYRQMLMDRARKGTE